MLGENTCTEVDRTTLLRTHYALQRGCFVSNTEEAPGGILAASADCSAPMWNHAAWLGEGSFLDFLKAGERWLSGRERHAAIYVAQPDDEHIRALTEAGYERFDREAWMLRPSGGERSSRVRKARDLGDFWAVFKNAFNVSEDGYSAALRRSGSQMHFVLYQEERPVAIGTLASQGELAAIYNVGTAPGFRKRGFAQELVQHLLEEAASAGCSQVFLQVSSGSSTEKLYRRTGFRLVFTREGFRKSEASAGTSLARVFSGQMTREPRHHRESRRLPVPSASRAHLLGAWAYLLHRYTGEDEVEFSLFETGATTPKCVRIGIQHKQRVKDWVATLEKLEVMSDERVCETALCLGSRSQALCSLEAQVDAAGTVHLVHRSERFGKEVVRRMAAHFCQALQSLVHQQNALVQELEILPDSERHQLLIEWNSVSFTPVKTTFSQLFEEQVERDPEATALLPAERPGEPISYRQLNRRANRLAHHLRRQGVGPEACVAVLLERSVDAVVAFLAILKAGGTIVPIDPEYPNERVNLVLHDSQAQVAVTHGKRSLPRGVRRVDLLADLAETNEKNPVTGTRDEHGAYIIYTSGSTGRPKGVLVSHGALANHCLDCRKTYGLHPADRVLQFSSFSFDAGLEQLFAPLISGATVVLRDMRLWSAPEFTAKLRELQVTVADLPTAYWSDVLECWAKNREALAYHTLRLMIVGGEALPPEKAALWMNAVGRKIRLINAYGPTETVITATSHELRGEDCENGHAPIGRPRGDRKVYVLDRFGRPVPIGVAGELHIGGTLLARGYYKNLKLTAERFIANPFSDDPTSRLYKTGDLVRYAEDGNLEFLGRIDDQVKVRGFRIEPGEIESALRQYPGVRDAVVLVQEGGLLAFVKGSVIAADAKAHLRTKLPDYMVPPLIIPVTDWPLLPSGKVDRKALLRQAQEAASPGALPEDALQLQLKLLFERVLHRTQVGVDQSFFDLGGDSLQALDLIVRIEKETGRKLPLESLYQASTVREIAQAIRIDRNENWSSLVPLQAGGARPPLFLLHTTPGDILGYGNLVYRLGADQPCYGLQSLGLKDAALSHHSITEMAAYYAKLIRELQPTGPYYLAGWCYGGIVAVEIARELKRCGADIGLLALFETVAMPATLTNLRYYAHRLKCMAAMSPARWLIYAREKARYNRQARLASRMRFRQAGCSEILDPRLQQLERVYNANMRALQAYRSRFYDGTVTLFNAAEKDSALIPDPQYGWAGLAGKTEIYEVPGNHDTMLTEPNVSVLARQLEDCLRKAQTKRTSP